MNNPNPLDTKRDLSLRWMGSIAEGDGENYTHHFEVNDLDGPMPGIYRVTFSTRTQVAYCEGDKKGTCRHAVQVATQVIKNIGVENLPNG